MGVVGQEGSGVRCRHRTGLTACHSGSLPDRLRLCGPGGFGRNERFRAVFLRHSHPDDTPCKSGCFLTNT
jgi:hypothetical protein